MYETGDICLAATLIIYGHPLVAVGPKPSRPNHAVFTFEHVDNEFLNDFDMGKILVDPRLMVFKVRFLTGIAQKRVGR